MGTTANTSNFFLNTVTPTGTRVTVCKICGAVVYEGNIAINGTTASARTIHLLFHADIEQHLEIKEDDENERSK